MRKILLRLMILNTSLTLPLAALGGNVVGVYEMNIHVHNSTNTVITVTTSPITNSYDSVTSNTNGQTQTDGSQVYNILKPGDHVDIQHLAFFFKVTKPALAEVEPFFSVYGYTMALVHNTSMNNWNDYQKYPDWQNIQWGDHGKNYYGFNIMYRDNNHGFQLYDAAPNSGQSPQPGCSYARSWVKNDGYIFEINCYITNQSIQDNLPG